jgi:hypothetical protein
MIVFYRFHALYLLLALLTDHGDAVVIHKDSKLQSGDDCLLNNITVSVFADPPYTTINGTGGVISDFIRLVLKLCFKSKSCSTREIEELQWKSLQSVDDLETLIKNEQTNIAFPVPPSLSTQRSRLSAKAKVEYFSVIHSPGPALIVDYQVCQRISNLLLTKTILSVWPIFLLTLLLAGISGVCIWALVCKRSLNHHLYQELHQYIDESV